ncbi:MAG TPA: carboxypeptidase regulatory-like domain-containing protein [Myxococcales bacterium]|nr:carboxypeptidase regulatory-like domain-containing protein [Myxococcales bacterium]
MILLALLLAADTGALAGKVTLTGLPPRLANLPVTRDQKTCGTAKPDESLEVKDGGVKNAVVWLTDVPEERDAPRPPKEKLDQQQCQFVPHIEVAPAGTTLDVVNSDKALHNVRAQQGETRLFNYAMPIPGHVVPTQLKKEGIFKVSCDVHPWMRAWLLVLDTRKYAVTAEDGTYKIEDVPPGKHHVKIWHERLGEREADVDIAAGQTATHDEAFNPR